jgi:hypothetical protein
MGRIKEKKKEKKEEGITIPSPKGLNELEEAIANGKRRRRRRKENHHLLFPFCSFFWRKEGTTKGGKRRSHLSLAIALFISFPLEA